MNVIVIGAAGTIGQAVTAALEASGHEVLRVGRTSGDYHADLTEAASLEQLFEGAQPFDAVVCAAGEAAFDRLADLSDEDFDRSLSSKLMGQVNLVRRARSYLHDRAGNDGDASITLVSGLLGHEPMPGSAAVSLVNAGVEGFARAAALDLPEGTRVNVVSPPWVSETLDALGRDPSKGLPAATVAEAFVASVEGDMSGEVLDARDYA